MPTNLQKLVKARREKTGESYATALRYVRRRAASRAASPRPDSPKTAPRSPRRKRYAAGVPRDPWIDAYASAQPEPLRGTLEKLVALVRAAVPGHDEVSRHGAPWFCIGGEPFCYVVGHAKHVNLGFCEGTSLRDPDGLLEGTGKAMRHVKLRPGKPIPPEKLTPLIRQSARRVRELQAADRRREARHAR